MQTEVWSFGQGCKGITSTAMVRYDWLWNILYIQTQSDVSLNTLKTGVTDQVLLVTKSVSAS